jgi:hypothetical protein
MRSCLGLHEERLGGINRVEEVTAEDGEKIGAAQPIETLHGAA